VWLEQQPGWLVCGEAANAGELFSRIAIGCPDLVLLDWELPGTRGICLLPALKALCPRMFVVYMGGRGELRAAVLRAGADAFMNKTDPPEKLLQLIETFDLQLKNVL
jgi:DNA-binding NarL/FixJ family response regulator